MAYGAARFYGPAQVPARYDPATGVQTRDAEIRVGPQPQLVGRVLGPDGSPVSGARVFAGPNLRLDGVHQAERGLGFQMPWGIRLPEATTDASGAFRVSGAAFRATVLVLHPAFAPLHRELRRVDQEVELRLSDGAPMSVLARAGDGRPEPGALVRTFLVERATETSFGCDVLGIDAAPAVTGADGLAVIDRVGAGTWRVEVASADGLRSGEAMVTVADPPRRSGAIVPLSVASRVFGRVRTLGGDPVPGAKVILGQLEPGVEVATRTDAAGAFEFRCARKGYVVDEKTEKGGYGHQVMVIGGSPDQFVDAGSWIPATPGQPLDVVAHVLAAQPVHLRIVDAESREPIPLGWWQSTVQLPSRPGWSTTNTWTFVAGEAAASAIPFPGSFLKVGATGYADVVLPVESIRGASVEVALRRASPKARLRIVIPGVLLSEVALFDAQTKRRVHHKAWPSRHEFVLEVDRAGDYLLTLASSEGGHLPAPLPCTLELGREVELPITLTPGGATLHARAAPKTVVTVTDAIGLTWDVTADSKGMAWFGTLAPGTYTLRVPDRSPEVVALVDGDHRQIDLRR